MIFSAIQCRSTNINAKTCQVRHALPGRVRNHRLPHLTGLQRFHCDSKWCVVMFHGVKHLDER
jgi:hypothetical protein